MNQQWDQLLFTHWPIDVDVMQSLLPKGMEVDVAEGKAWVSVVPFQMSNIHFRGLPKVPGLDSFLELNVRTYVKVNGVPAVYFFSLDANHRPGVWIAKTFFHLNYRLAEMNWNQSKEEIRFRSARRVDGEEKSIFRATYKPLGEPILKEERLITDWLTERYHLFSVDRKGRIYTGKVIHPTWSLEQVEVDIEAVQLTKEHGLPIQGKPVLASYSHMLGVRVTAISRI